MLDIVYDTGDSSRRGLEIDAAEMRAIQALSVVIRLSQLDNGGSKLPCCPRVLCGL